MTETSYPTRPPFFAMKFVRQLVKRCVANEHGAQVFTLLVTVVATEDSAKYQRPVTFYDTQLMPVLGANSRDTLYRIRNRAVTSGWLRYTAGRKGVPGTYWVTIPDGADGFTDAPVDENPEELRADSVADLQQKAGRKPAESATESRQKAGRISHTSLPMPFPIPEPASAGPSSTSRGRAATNENEQKPRRRPSGPQQEAFEAFGTAWEAKYGARYAFSGGKDGVAVKWMLQQLGGDVQRFRAVVDRFLAADEKFYRDGGHELGLLRKHFNRFQVEPRRPADRHAGYDLLPGQPYTPPTAEPMFPTGAAAPRREGGPR